jgi:hypothetical protein
MMDISRPRGLLDSRRYISMVAKKDAGAVATAIDWSKVNDLATARELLGTVVDSADAVGDGADFITDKHVLVDVAFLVLEWKFITDEASNREYVNVHIMGADGRRARFNDGSTGVYAQLKKVSEEMGVIGIAVKKGLRPSEYTKELPDGSKTKATTFYLSA